MDNLIQESARGGETPRCGVPGARWRWAAHLGLLALYPLLAFWRAVLHEETDGAVLPSTVPGLITLGLLQMSLMLALLTGAWLFSRFVPGDLWVRRWRGAMTVIQGLLFSVLLRVALAVVGFFGVVGAAALGFKPKVVEAFVRQYGPHSGGLVDNAALRHPVYLLVMTTFISFGVAALSEELWRAGSMAAWLRLLPASMSARDRSYWALGLSAFIFGLGHLSQGPLAMGAAAMLGVALGAIMLRMDSIWPAVMAHGFFDATSFLLLPLAAKHGGF